MYKVPFRRYDVVVCCVTSTLTSVFSNTTVMQDWQRNPKAQQAQHHPLFSTSRHLSINLLTRILLSPYWTTQTTQTTVLHRTTFIYCPGPGDLGICRHVVQWEKTTSISQSTIRPSSFWSEFSSSSLSIHILLIILLAFSIQSLDGSMGLGLGLGLGLKKVIRDNFIHYWYWIQYWTIVRSW